MSSEKTPPAVPVQPAPAQRAPVVEPHAKKVIESRTVPVPPVGERETATARILPEPSAMEQEIEQMSARQDSYSFDRDAELSGSLSDDSFDALMSGGDAGSAEEETIEPESRQHGARGRCATRGRVRRVGRPRAGLSAAGPVRHAAQAWRHGGSHRAKAQRRRRPLRSALPSAAAEVGDWGDLHEGMSVEAQVTGHNAGGLECEINHIRGFIPVSQIALYRVEDLAQFVGQRMTCLVTEANPARRNLVLSRRAVLEREKEEAREKLLQSLQPGQVHEGVVRKLMDFGAFVDIGGVDGLLHVSQLAWSRVNHPREVLHEGQQIRVKIEKIDHETGKIGFSYRDMLENPWTSAAAKFPPTAVVRGKVTKLMEFGAFVELEPGVEGLVHISELSHKRVWRASDIVHEGEEVEVLVLAVDAEAQRISLSMKALSKPEPTKAEKEAGEAAQSALPAAAKCSIRRNQPLQGGLGKASGEQFGLKW